MKNKHRGKNCFVCGKEGKIIKESDTLETKGNQIGLVSMGAAIWRAAKTRRHRIGDSPEVRSCCGRVWVPSGGVI